MIRKMNIKQKVALALSMVFMCTGLLVKISGYTMDIKKIIINDDDNIKEGIKEEEEKANDKRKQREIRIRMGELSKTLGQGIDYISIYINEDKFKQAQALSEDCYDALDSIEDATKSIKDKNAINIKENTKVLRSHFYDLNVNLDKGDKQKALTIINEKLYPFYKKFLKDVYVIIKI